MVEPQPYGPAWRPPVFQPVRTPRTYQEAIEQIAEAVRAGDMRIGDRLPSERALAQQMGISRPTVREAIRALADVGVLQTRSGGGTVVRSDLVPIELLANRTELNFTEVAGVLEARRLLEPRVAQLAALRLDDGDVARIQDIIDLQHERIEDTTQYGVLELRFHLAIARATKNATIVELMRSLLAKLDVAREMAMRTLATMDPAVEVHERTFRSICAGDPVDIEVAMDEHLAYLEDRWEEVTGRARLRQIPDFLLPHPGRSSQGD